MGKIIDVDFKTKKRVLTYDDGVDQQRLKDFYDLLKVMSESYAKLVPDPLKVEEFSYVLLKLFEEVRKEHGSFKLSRSKRGRTLQ